MVDDRGQAQCQESASDGDVRHPSRRSGRGAGTDANPLGSRPHEQGAEQERDAHNPGDIRAPSRASDSHFRCAPGAKRQCIGRCNVHDIHQGTANHRGAAVTGSPHGATDCKLQGQGDHADQANGKERDARFRHISGPARKRDQRFGDEPSHAREEEAENGSQDHPLAQGIPGDCRSARSCRLRDDDRRTDSECTQGTECDEHDLQAHA